MNNRKPNRHERAMVKHQMEFKKEKMRQEKRNGSYY
ncbi:MAG: hypothetical protein A4E24_00042 [Methanomethylovorans sp. PtaU1.Bin093]|nr:MAG: hypothetical protein A4E24_00042 [Methanomethylovorans sp. PtaU1.Bin093]